MKEDGYRLNVGLIISNNEGKLLLCKRKGMNSWQFPQGGIDNNESPLSTAQRELFEEVGIQSKSTKLISSIDGWLKYDVPKKSRRRRFLNKKFKGQKQKWFLFRLKEDQGLINRMGFNNGGVKEAAKRLKTRKNNSII